MSKPKKVAILTAGGLAPCLSSAVGGLIERYTEIDPSIEIICYRSGYKGLLLGDAYPVTPEIRAACPRVAGRCAWSFCLTSLDRLPIAP